jgi:hypothetical protein
MFNNIKIDSNSLVTSFNSIAGNDDKLINSLIFEDDGVEGLKKMTLDILNLIQRKIEKINDYIVDLTFEKYQNIDENNKTIAKS